MDWYCAVWNSDKVSNEMGAQFLYEKICEGETSLVEDIDRIDEFYDELILKNQKINASKGKGFVVIGCDSDNAEFFYELVQVLAKKHGLSFYEPQNMTYVF